ncbi:MAG: hypothetical protein FWD26_08455 [Treponema sp.]|nr:hypothetical protein [Treponema sp.]
MKKISFALIICLIVLPSIYAFDDDDGFNTKKAPFRIKDRSFEIGINAAFGVSNDFLSIGEIFSKEVFLDLDKLKDGLRMGFGANVSPFFLNINGAKWGFGISTNLDLTGSLALNGNMLSFANATDEKSEFNGAAFLSASINTYFHIAKFKVSVKPSIFYPIAYVQSNDISYTFESVSGQNRMFIGYDIAAYTAFPVDMDNLSLPTSFGDLTASPGFDFSVGVEFPIARALGLTSILPFLDFDIGLDVVNIPIISSNMKNYARITGVIGSTDLADFDEFFDNFDFSDPVISYHEDSKGKSAERPFKLLVSANWRPFGNFLTITPSVGFSIDTLYYELGAPEFGLKAKISLINMLNATLGIAYEDRIWRNSLNLALNFRIVELVVGAELQSPDFLGSWSAKGVGVNIGVRFGW